MQLAIALAVAEAVLCFLLPWVDEVCGLYLPVVQAKSQALKQKRLAALKKRQVEAERVRQETLASGGSMMVRLLLALL
jgi:hypothetical protein